jgi:NAD(P)-dependent dehydrogenase (short-subunit alcohol dehydrogenase family)
MSQGKKRLEGKVAIVTGTGRGIGRAEAMMLGEQGAKVIVNDLDGGQRDRA